jgi:hypothetical protein
MKKLFIVALMVLVARASLSLAQGVDEGAQKAKGHDKSSPSLMKEGGAPKPTPAAAGLAVSDPGDPSTKSHKKGTK